MKKWTFDEAFTIFNMPFLTLIDKAHSVHKTHFDECCVQISTLLSLQTGGCSEDCAYCAQSIKNGTKMEKQPLLDIQTVLESAKKAKENGSTRFCMGTSGKCQSGLAFEKICEIVREVKKIGLETCLTIGKLTREQVKKLKEAGLNYYNHNVDTSPEFYKNVITTRTIEDRIETINLISESGIKLCAGGIIGMGETNEDRVNMLILLANLDVQPASVPINKLVRIPGTKLANAENVDSFDFVKVIALARIMMPSSYIRLSAGRENMPDELQALCFFAGANSFFAGDKLLTVNNRSNTSDDLLLQKLGITKKTIGKN